jgi:hypothetical protein
MQPADARTKKMRKRHKKERRKKLKTEKLLSLLDRIFA